MNNRLYCTFVPEEDVNSIVDKSYNIIDEHYEDEKNYLQETVNL